MRYFISLIVINIALITSVLLKVLPDEAEKATTMPKVIGLSLDEALNELKSFEVEINYVESEMAKDTLINSYPQENSLVYYGQDIIINVSKGYITKKYLDITNTLYQENLEYLKQLKENYAIKIIVNYINDSEKIDGLIINTNFEGEIKENDTLIIDVVSNPKTLIIPDFTGLYYQEVLGFAEKYGIKVKFFYIEGFLASDFVVSQNIKPGTSVLKNGCYLEIYLQE